MKISKSFKMLILTAISSFGLWAQAGTSNLVKTQREDFNLIIQEGLEAQKELREELRQNAGMTKSGREWTEEINEKGPVLMGVVETEQRVSPTTNFVRPKPIRPSATERGQERVAEEYISLEN